MKQVDNREIYNENWSKWSDMKVYGPASRWLRSLITKLSTKTNSSLRSILDVGCGEGTNTYLLSNLYPNAKVKGIDFSETGIAEANRLSKENLTFEVDIDSISLNNKYDLITCFEVLEHVEDWKNLLDRIAQASSKYIMLSFPTGRMRDFEVNVGHLRNFKKKEVEDYLYQKGIKPVHIFYAGFPFYNPIYREVCNLTNAANNSFTMGKYNWKQKLIANLLYISFNYMSSKESLGDQFCGLFEK